MRTLFLPILAGLALIAPPGTAQEKAKPLAAFEKIKAEYDAAYAAYKDARAKLAKTDEYKEAIKNRDRQAMMALSRKVKPVSTASYVERMQKLAATDEACEVPALTWITRHGRRDREAIESAVDILRAKYFGSRELVDFAESMGAVGRALGRERFAELVEELIEKTPDKMTKANALYIRAMFNRPGRRNPDADEKAYEADLAKVAELAKGTLLGLRANGPKFEKTRLQIGMAVPDITGKDLAGVDFKLSDYKGKVIVLDFWGDW